MPVYWPHGLTYPWVLAVYATARLQRSRGFGFIEFRNADDADEAIYKMDNSTLDGRQINVSPAVSIMFVNLSATSRMQGGFSTGVIART